MATLLAVDTGLECGMACWSMEGVLLWHESRRFSTLGTLRRATSTFFNRCPDLRWLVCEGGGARATPWLRAAERLQVCHWVVSAEEWRHDLLPPSRRLAGSDFKALARRQAAVLLRSCKTLDHNAAEAILLGHCAVGKLRTLE